MNSAQLFSDVRARLLSDTGIHGLFPASSSGRLPIPPMVTDVVNNYFTPGQSVPFIVFDLVSGPPDDCFDVDMSNVVFQLSLYNTKTPANLEPSQAILNRLYGDAISQNGEASYGLHKWNPMTSQWPSSRDPSDRWKYTPCTHLRSPPPQHTDDYFHFIQQYTLRMWKDISTAQ